MIDLDDYQKRFPSHISALYEVHRLTGRVIDLEQAHAKNRETFERIREENRALRSEVRTLRQEIDRRDGR